MQRDAKPFVLPADVSAAHWVFRPQRPSPESPQASAARQAFFARLAGGYQAGSPLSNPVRLGGVGHGAVVPGLPRVQSIQPRKPEGSG